mmetsp:Transcript_7117/g.15209  ORF Transcript_7117/g.15209 Transcript_7117/m.15209 type:complete len:372 (+) Transcript_7117:164-1279(+)|eukprot:CAMPEP_0185844016 /NCGR_PEP_ID=MMETSP1354-20130828/341_1 /TAXON_ID=708628 /ORGANISM="Erythrolobus madagascarensis, Strain CCMP3276" /LENGTH=371 /DNA_ID=CAMNT_0028543621 /DNA_START=185 /DNA_END=1300 /DNA_ORIENTATION=-
METGLLWVDKYRPGALGKLEIHQELNARLQRLCAGGDLPHLFLYGPTGGGKRTRVHGVLRELFGSSADKVKVEHRVFRLGEPQKDVELTTISSNHHIELSASDADANDRLVVQEIIKEIASSVPLDFAHRSSAEVGTGEKPRAGFKVVVLHDVHRMTRLAQQALRRTMEKYSRTCRLVLVAESASKVIEPLRSRCLGIRVPLPSDTEIASVLRSVCRSESLVLPDAFAEKLAVASGGNLRRAVLQLEASKATQYPFAPDQKPVRAEWELACADIGRMIMANQSPRVLLEVRSKLYDLLSHAVPAEVVFRSVVKELLKNLDQDLAPRVLQCAAHYQRRMRRGSKPIMHLEAFIARFMQIYKAYLAAMLDMNF